MTQKVCSQRSALEYFQINFMQSTSQESVFLIDISSDSSVKYLNRSVLSWSYIDQTYYLDNEPLDRTVTDDSLSKDALPNQY